MGLANPHRHHRRVVEQIAAAPLIRVRALGPVEIVEVEARKGLGFLGERLEPLSVFSNATLMRSEIRIGNEGLASTTNPNRPMLGQVVLEVRPDGLVPVDRGG